MQMTVVTRSYFRYYL